MDIDHDENEPLDIDVAIGDAPEVIDEEAKILDDEFTIEGADGVPETKILVDDELDEDATETF